MVNYLLFPLTPPPPGAITGRAILHHWHPQATYAPRAPRQLRAMSLAMPGEALHLNSLPFTGVLCLCDQASTRAPGGARGHRVRISAGTMQRCMGSLLEQGVNADAA